MDYSKIIEQLKDLAQAWVSPYLNHAKLLDEVVVENPAITDLEKYLAIQAPNFRTEPYPFIHVPQKFSNQYLELLVKFDLPPAYRESKLAIVLFDQAVASENSESVVLLFDHGFQLTQEAKANLILTHLESVLMCSTENGAELDFVFLRQLRETPMFNDFSLDNHPEFCQYIDEHFVPLLEEFFSNRQIRTEIYQEINSGKH